MCPRGFGQICRLLLLVVCHTLSQRSDPPPQALLGKARVLEAQAQLQAAADQAGELAVRCASRGQAGWMMAAGSWQQWACTSS
jgi:hypothetical protein